MLWHMELWDTMLYRTAYTSQPHLNTPSCPKWYAVKHLSGQHALMCGMNTRMSTY